MVFDSGLAEHIRNLGRDQRASLLVVESGSEDPLANGRVTMLGPCRGVDEDGGSARAAFLAAHPNSACYADFSDFAFWKLRVNAIRYIGERRPRGRAGALHKAFSKATDITSAKMTGVDRYGFDLSAKTPRVRDPSAWRSPRRSARR